MGDSPYMYEDLLVFGSSDSASSDTYGDASANTTALQSASSTAADYFGDDGESSSSSFGAQFLLGDDIPGLSASHERVASESWPAGRAPGADELGSDEESSSSSISAQSTAVWTAQPAYFEGDEEPSSSSFSAQFLLGDDIPDINASHERDASESWPAGRAPGAHELGIDEPSAGSSVPFQSFEGSQDPFGAGVVSEAHAFSRQESLRSSFSRTMGGAEVFQGPPRADVGYDDSSSAERSRARAAVAPRPELEIAGGPTRNTPHDQAGEGQNPVWAGLSDPRRRQAVEKVATTAAAAAAAAAVPGSSSMLRDDLYINPILDGEQPRSPRDSRAPISDVLKMALACAATRGRASTQQLWRCAEILLHDETYPFKMRPAALYDDRGIFREDVAVRRRTRAGTDRWQNSGGQKGSTVWPPGDEVARLRCRYGKVTREGRLTLRYQVFTKIHRPEDQDPRILALSQRRLFVVTPQRGKQQPAAAVASSWSSAISATEPGATELPSTEIQASPPLDVLVSKVEVIAADLAIDDSNLLNHIYELLSQVSIASTEQLVQYHRPDVLPNSLEKKQIFVEHGKIRRGGKGVTGVDRWSNLGGKRAVRQYSLSGDRVLQKRAGRIHRFSDGSNTASQPEQLDMRYQQYNIASDRTGGNKRIPEAATVFLVYKNEPSTTGASKRAVKSEMHGSRNSKVQRVASSAAVLASLLGLFGLVWVSTMRSSGFGQPSPSSDDASTCAQGLYLLTTNRELLADSDNHTHKCVKCTECGPQGEYESGASIEKPCTATSDTVCRPWTAVWRHLDMAVDDPSTHVPQFAATWQAGDAVYMFGGSGSARKNRMTRTNAYEGLTCYATAIGITDELWKLEHPHSSRNGTWSLVSGGGLSSSSDSQVLPAGRTGAASWSVNKHTDGMIFGGSFDLCVVPKAPPSPPDQYVISGCNNATHCGTFDRSNSKCAGAPVFENAHNSTVLLRVINGPRSRWIVAPRVQAQTTDGDSQCDASDHYLESSWKTLSDAISNPSALGVADLYHDWSSGNSVWWEVVPGKVHAFELLGDDFSIVGRHRSNQSDSDTGTNSKRRGINQDHEQAQDYPIVSRSTGTRPPALEQQFVDDSGFYMPPTALYLYSKAGWSLLGGNDVWTQLTSVEAAEAISNGFVPTGETFDQWPLPRSHTQTFTIEGSDGGGTLWGSAGAYMFSGRFQMVHSKLEGADHGGRTEDRLLNDLWIFNSKQPSGSEPVVERVALCGHTVDRPDLLPYGTSYPGGRQEAATWSVVVNDDWCPYQGSYTCNPALLSSIEASCSAGNDPTSECIRQNQVAHDGNGCWKVSCARGQGWMFGGVGRPLSLSTQAADPCSSQPFFTSNGAGVTVASLCDLWMLQPGLGWKLMYACSRDKAVFRGEGLTVPPIPGPTGSIMSTAWVQPEENDGLANHEDSAFPAGPVLWLFGGVMDCAEPVSPGCVDDRDGLIARLHRNCGELVSALGCHADLHDWFVAAPESSLLSAACPTVCGGCTPIHATLQRSTDETDVRGSVAGSHGEEGERVCDTVWRMAEPSESDLDTLPCSADLWKFSIRTLKWDRVHPQQSHGRGPSRGSSLEHWPAGRCGAYHAGGDRSSSLNGRGADEMLLAGGWSGSALGVCDAMGARSDFLPYSLEPRDIYVDGLLHATVPWYAAHGEAICNAVVDVWRFDGEVDVLLE